MLMKYILRDYNFSVLLNKVHNNKRNIYNHPDHTDLLVSNVSIVESVSIGLTTNSSSLILASVSSVIFNTSGAIKKVNNFITVQLAICDKLR